MSTHRSHPLPRKPPRRAPDDLLFMDGVQRLYIFACGANDRHRVAVPHCSLEAVPKGRCPACGGALTLQSTLWEGEVPSDGYDLEAAQEALILDGYYT